MESITEIRIVVDVGSLYARFHALSDGVTPRTTLYQ
jgi:hypothetical protein